VVRADADLKGTYSRMSIPQPLATDGFSYSQLFRFGSLDIGKIPLVTYPAKLACERFDLIAARAPGCSP
jgi:hypothetical protein